jgi:hypothetical protein
MSGPQSSVTSSAPGATVQPFITQGLQEAQRLYQTSPIQPYTGQMYVAPSQATQQALQLAQQRATAGSPLAQAAMQQQQQTISGDYLGMNPFFEGAFQAASRPVQQSFQDAMANLSSQASRAGRYGSGAMQQLQARATEQLAEQLSNIGGTLAFRGYESERARQEEAARAAPAMAQSEYQDIQRLLSTGQAAESYDQARIAADMARFQQQQMAPYANLQSYLSSVYGAPAGQQVTTTYEPNKLLEGLGLALAGSTLLSDPNSPLKGALGQLGGAGTAVFDWLRGQFGGTNSYGVTPAQAAANLSAIERSMGG